MSPEWIVMGVGGLLAIMTLVRLMLRRQDQLRGLLRTYVDSQMEWSRKKARAALMARRAAKQMANSEDLSPLTEMLHQNDASSDAVELEESLPQS